MYEPTKPPPYASMVIVELFRDINAQKHELRFLFRNRTSPVTILENNTLQTDDIGSDEDTKPYVKHLFGKCEEFCALEDFERMTSHLRLNNLDWKVKCNLVEDPVIQVSYLKWDYKLNNPYLI